MRARRARLIAALREDEIAPTIVVFPLLGVEDTSGVAGSTRGAVADSATLPDEVINPHPRFGALTRNIRMSHARPRRHAKLERSAGCLPKSGGSLSFESERERERERGLFVSLSLSLSEQEEKTYAACAGVAGATWTSRCRSSWTSARRIARRQLDGPRFRSLVRV